MANKATNHELFNAIINNDLPRLKHIISTPDININGYISNIMTGGKSFAYLYLAVQKENPDIIKHLIMAGANINIQSGTYDWTPLHYAACGGNELIIKILLEHGASVDCQDKNMYTAADLAEFNGYYDMAEYIRSYGVPVKWVN